MKVYLVYEYDNCDYTRTNLKVYKSEEDARNWCKAQPHIPSTEFNYDEIDAEGF